MNAYFQLLYKGVDISGALNPETTSVTYTDHLHGRAHEIAVCVHDTQGKWRGAWFPQTGDRMELTIFDGRGGVLPCGAFEMDAPEARGGRGGDMMHIRGLAAPISKSLRTQKTRAFESQSTKSIVLQIAGELGLRHIGTINDLEHARVTQRRARPLAFLKTLAEETGHYFNVVGDQLIFTNFASIDGQAPALSVTLGDDILVNYRFGFKNAGTYSAGHASYFDERRDEQNECKVRDELVQNGDILRLSGERMESAAHAQARLQSGLHFANRGRFCGQIDTIGHVQLVAGNVVQLAGFGAYSGRRVIETSTHQLTRQGYTTQAELVDAR